MKVTRPKRLSTKAPQVGPHIVRKCRQCDNELVRYSPSKPTGYDIIWGADPRGQFYCEKCDLKTSAPLRQEEPRDLELAPQARA